MSYANAIRRTILSDIPIYLEETHHTTFSPYLFSTSKIERELW
jgi:hypothetical protein